MVGEKIEKAFNGQLNAEAYSAYLYLSMSAALDKMGLGGFAKWMRAQAQEELSHAMRFYSHIIERDGTVMLAPIEQPPGEWKDVQAVFEHTLRHEQKVTGLIKGLVELAGREKDEAARDFLRWFEDEQVEEEQSAESVLKKLEQAAGKPDGIAALDKEMGTRVFVPSVEEGGE